MSGTGKISLTFVMLDSKYYVLQSIAGILAVFLRGYDDEFNDM